MLTTVTAPKEQKRVYITSKRQFTIPQKYFVELGFDREAICSVVDGKLILQPVTNEGGGEFAEQILADLIAKGLSGEELLSEFRSCQTKVRPAVEKMLESAHKAAVGAGEYSTYDDVFCAEK